MNELTNGKTMTVKEVADALGTAESTIRNKVKELFPEIIKNGVATTLNENQVFTIKKNIVPRDLTLKSKVENAVTIIDRQKTIILAMQYLQEDYNIMKQRAELAEQKCIEQQPKVVLCDALTSAKNAIYMADAIKILETGFGRNIAFRKLRQLHILQENNLPYQEYIDRGYFRVKENVFTINGNNYINKTTMVYQRGMDFLRKFFTENK